jgi:hypothetical protein
VAGVDDDAEQLVIGRVDVQQVHARRGHHRVASRQLGHAQDAFEHLARLGLDQLAMLGIGQGFDQFGLGVRAGVQELQHALQQATRLGRMFGGPANWGPA